MRNAKCFAAASAVLIALMAASSAGGAATEFVPLFNGRDFSGWKIPAGDNGHWRASTA